MFKDAEKNSNSLSFSKNSVFKGLKKLVRYVIKMRSCSGWIRSFLSDRNQFVKVNAVKSEKRKLLSNVIGPLLFVLYFNDLPEVVRAILCLFTDVTKLLKIVSSLQDSILLQKRHQCTQGMVENLASQVSSEKSFRKVRKANSIVDLISKEFFPPVSSFTITTFVGPHLEYANKLSGYQKLRKNHQN